MLLCHKRLIVTVKQHRNYKEPSLRLSSFQIINLKSNYLQVQSIGIMKEFLQRINKILTQFSDLQNYNMKEHYYLYEYINIFL